MKRNYLHNSAILIIALVFAGVLPGSVHAAPAPIPSHDAGLQVDVWTDRGEGSVYRSGDNVFVYFRPSDDCYLTIYDIDTEGQVRVLFPLYPDDGFVFGGMTYRIPDYYDHYTLTARGPRGVEYIHAVATRQPRLFRYRISDRRYFIDTDAITDDPFIAMNAINARLIPQHSIHATATTSFFVDGRVWYPRYVCNSCHNPVRTRYFDPYRSVCSRYSVIPAHDYDYWWMYDYHPVSTRFVFVRPFWRFEYRTGPYRRNRYASYLDCAFGYSNYRPVRPPMRAYVEGERKSPRDTERRTLERTYTPVRYDELRTRTNIGTTRTGTIDRSRQLDDQSRIRDAVGSRVSERDRNQTGLNQIDAARSSATRDDAASSVRLEQSTRSTISPGTGESRSQSVRDRAAGTDATNRSRTPVIGNARTIDIPTKPATRMRDDAERNRSSAPAQERVRTQTPSTQSSRNPEGDRTRVETSRTSDRTASPTSRQDNSNEQPRDRSSRTTDERSR